MNAQHLAPMTANRIVITQLDRTHVVVTQATLLTVMIALVQVCILSVIPSYTSIRKLAYEENKKNLLLLIMPGVIIILYYGRKLQL